MDNILCNFISCLLDMGFSIDFGVFDFFMLIVAILSLFVSKRTIERNRWEAASRFLLQVDSEEMRAARKIVYEYYGQKSKKQKKIKKALPEQTETKKTNNNIVSYQEFEKAVTRVIAFYDGNAKLTLEGYIPKKLFEGTTLFTAARFYSTVSGYINKRRTEEKQSGYNEVYALNYAKLLADRNIERKLKKFDSLKGSNEIIYKVAYKNVSEMCSKRR